MSFLSPFLLAGAAAVGIPVLLHFLFKAWYRPLPWAAMEFLRKALEQTTRRIKFRELILLLLRCLCLLLLAFALARPVLGWNSASGRGESVDAVLVFDTSYSMGAKDGGKTRFERAQNAAISVIDNLPPHSTAQVIVCSDRATTVPFTPGNLDQARSVVRSLKLTSQQGDLTPALNEAYAALDRTAGANKELYVFSDLQRNGLEGSVNAKAMELKQRASVVFVRCGNEKATIKNVAVIDITFPDAIPHTGTRLPFTVLLKNTGREPVENIAVSLAVDGGKREKDEDVDTGIAPRIEPGATFPVTMTAALNEAGPRILTARIGIPSTDPGGRTTATAVQPDDLPGDNRFDKLILVRQKIQVLVVDGRPDFRDPKDSASHFIANAIIPIAETQRDDYFIRARVVSAEMAANERLHDYQICVLVNVPAEAEDKPGIPALTPEFVSNLKRFVTEGGGLLIGCGDFVVPPSYNRVLGSGGANLLPFDLTAKSEATAANPFKPAPDTVEVPSFLSRLRDDPFSTATADVDVLAVLGANEVPRTGQGHVVLRLDNQKPMVSAKTVGSGEVVMVHTSLDSTWTNWPGRAGGASYVATVRFALSHLTGKAGRGGNLIAGQKITWSPPDATVDCELVGPEGARVRLGQAVGGGDGTKPTVTVTDTTTAGEYRIVFPGLKDEETPRYAVNPDLRESDNLDLLSDDAIEGKLGFRPVLAVAGNETDTVGRVRAKREWTMWALLGLFVLLCVETAWAWFCGRAV
jgi:hypothetical protein